ncbi:MAG: ABC-F family ATP-binding cassette domain-containing protein [Armatimonadetes bacterium]|nr:ABC-F family ATP-binding cassette domain-containing protein [Armatimonadota bacterium]
MILQADHITKSYGATAVLSDVSLKIEAGERVGLVGVNGAGKSTLLNILVGELAADEGTVTIARDARIGYLRQDSGLQSDRTIEQELLDVFRPLVEAREELRRLEARLEGDDGLGASAPGPPGRGQVSAPATETADHEALLARYVALSDWFRAQGGFEIEARIANVVSGMGLGHLPRHLVVSSLSGGQKTRLALARLLLEQPDLLVLDEPTNHLDFPTLAWLEGHLRAYPGAVMIVSHDRYFLDALVTSICELERTKLNRYTGNYTRFVEQKAQNRELQRRRYNQQQQEIARTQEWIERHRARATSARAAQSRIRALERLERIEHPDTELRQARFAFRAGEPSYRDVLVVDDLQVSVGHGESRKVLLTGIGLTLQRGDRVGIIGPNGIGKSTLLKTLVGRHEADSGTVRWGERVRLGYYDQEQCELDPDLTVLQQLRHWFPKVPEERLRNVLGGFLFSGEEVLKPTPALSGGERARVALARLMLQEPNVLLLDEPTNHLDLASKEMLESALQGYDGTLLFVSHSRYLLNRLARRILEMSSTGLKAYEGNYDAYAARKAAEAEAEAAALANRTTAQVRAEQPAERAQFEASRRSQRDEELRRRRVAQLEQKIEQLEAAIRLIEQSMAAPGVATDPVALQQRCDVAEKRRGELQSCYAEWERLMAEE